MRSTSHLYSEHYRLVYRRARRMLGNHADAEEALQDVFTSVLSDIAPYQGKGELSAWLSTITKNHCLKRIRDQKRRSALLQEHVVPAAKDYTTQKPIERLTLRWLLNNADAQQAQAAVYVYLDGLSYRGAARRLGVGHATIGNLLERFRTFCAALACE